MIEILKLIDMAVADDRGGSQSVRALASTS